VSSGIAEKLRSNAFTGSVVAEGKVDPVWGAQNAPPERKRFLADFEPDLDLHKWDDLRVGYGIIVAHSAQYNDARLAAGEDLPQSLRELAAQRKAPVLHFTPGNFQYLTNFAANKDFDIGNSGIGVTGIPQYLLIVGGPELVPWRIQFQLNSRRFVGRLPLDGAALDRYIQYLLKEWEGSESRMNQPVVWSTNHGYPDITELMSAVVAKTLHQRYAKHSNIGDQATLLDSAAATRANLCGTLRAKRPALIVSTSHGLIAPLEQPEKIGASIGTPVDQNYQTLDLAELFSGWQPDGAIWYAHACCSAGTSGAGCLAGLASPESDLGLTISALSKTVPTVAPLRMLAAEKPARAFIGHVEPTFDCTLRNNDSGELFTQPIVDALYTQLLQQNSAGFAMQSLLGPLASVNSAFLNAKRDFKGGDDELAQLLIYSLAGVDIEGTVLLGDPTVRLPKLA
jgi:hypothetical protein